MKVAVLDLGSNSFHMVVARVGEGEGIARIVDQREEFSTRGC